MRAAGTIVLASSLMALALFAGGPSTGTWASYSSTGSAGAVFAAAAPACVAWTAEDVVVDGSRNVFHGCVHADRDASVLGRGSEFRGRLDYVRAFESNDAGHVFARGRWQVLPAEEPDPVAVAGYRPGGPLALAAGAAFHAHEGDAVVSAESPPGIHHVAGNAQVVLSPHALLRVTVVAEGDVTVVGNGGALAAYADGVALVAGGDGPTALLVAGNGNEVAGRLAAPAGALHVAGHENVLERVGARVLKVTGTDNEFGRP